MPTFATPAPIVALVETGPGHLRFAASDRVDTVVEVRPTNQAEDADVRAAEQAQVDYVGGQLRVKAPRSRFRLFGRPPSVDVTIELPTGSRVEAKAWADVRSEGRLGDSTFETAAGSVQLDQTGRLKARTAAGDVTVAHAAGPVDLTSASGKIRIGLVDGAAVAKTSNGDITVGEATGDLRMNTANGDITVDRALATVVAKTAFGSIRIGEVVRGSVALQTSFGEVELGVREGTAAWLDVRAPGGSVRSDLDTADAPQPSDETVEVRARTSFGDIVIRRAAAATPTAPVTSEAPDAPEAPEAGE